MRHRLFALALLLLALAPAGAQVPSFGNIPVEINSPNQRFVNGVAVAEGDVEIIYGDTMIYADYGQYNPDTRDVLVIGNVRIYREGRTFVTERALYNIETKQLRASDVRGEFYPFEFSANSVLTLGSGGGFQANDAIFTTSDSAKPDYHIRARTVRIYPKDRIVMSNVTLYVGKLPVFWYPYLYQSLEKDQSFTYTPGYSSVWGAFVLSQYTYPIAEGISGQVRLDLRTQRGVAVGFNSDFKYGTDNRNWGKFRSYFLDDANSSINKTALAREQVQSARYRVSLQHRLYVTDDIYASIDINKLSDGRFLQDFFEHEFRLDPQPDNVIALTKLSENFTINAIARKQLNSFQDVTERLPEIVLDVKRHALFNSPIFYEGETSAARLSRNFGTGSLFPDYNSSRLDTFHQLLFPHTYFDWLAFTPRVGGRVTYYTKSGGYNSPDGGVQDTIGAINLGVPGGTPTLSGSARNLLVHQGSVFRPVFDAGFESSFKLSRAYENAQSRFLGLDGLRHVVQPYTDFSYVVSGQRPDTIFQFDRLNPSDRVPPLDLPEFTAVDAISNLSIWRFGVRNRLETRRDNNTFNWLDLDTYVDWNIDQPEFRSVLFSQSTFSNVVNRLRFNPVPWVSLQMEAQLPLISRGFTEVNTDLNFLATQNLKFSLGHRYIHGNAFFEDSSLVTFGTYFRINDNWGFSLREQYEVQDHTLESQRYEIHRDLSSWIASFGLLFRNNKTSISSTNKSTNEVGFMVTFTLKDLPQINIPFGQSPDASGGVKGK